jgi:hypothetical protein
MGCPKAGSKNIPSQAIKLVETKNLKNKQRRKSSKKNSEREVVCDFLNGTETSSEEASQQPEKLQAQHQQAKQEAEQNKKSHQARMMVQIGSLGHAIH